MANKILELFGIDTDQLIGLDISATAIKVMELSKKGDQIKVERYAMQPLEPGIVVERNIINKEAVIAALKEVFIKNKIKSRKVCVAIAGSASITRTIKLSADLSDKEIGNEIELEAEKYLPYARDEVNLDYTVIGPVEEEEGMVNVLLVITKLENVDKIEELMTAAELVPVVVDIDSYVLERAFELVVKKIPAQGREKTLALFDIGATITSMNVYNHQKIVYNRELPFGGQQLIDEIQNHYGLTYDEAVMAFQFQDLPDDYVVEILEPFKQTVAQQIARSCQFFFSSGDFSVIDYIFLTGGVSAIPNIDAVVQNKTHFKTFIANPFSDFLIPKHINIDAFKRDIPRLMNCCGLALRNVIDK